VGLRFFPARIVPADQKRSETLEGQFALRGSKIPTRMITISLAIGKYTCIIIGSRAFLLPISGAPLVKQEEWSDRGSLIVEFAQANPEILVEVKPARNKAAPAPQTVQDTGASANLLEDITIKILFVRGEQSLYELTRELGLSFAVVNEIFDRLRREQFVEVKGMTGLAYRTALTDRGRSRAQELLSLNQYAGHAPVSLKEYTSRVQAQSITKAEVPRGGLQQALAHLVLEAPTLKRLGTAVVSGASILTLWACGNRQDQYRGGPSECIR